MTINIENPIDMSSAFDSRLNRGDIDGLMELLAPGAISRTPEGEVLQDPVAIRDNLAGLIAQGAVLHNEPKHILVGGGDAALLLIEWTLSFGGEQLSAATGTTANVLVRDKESGSWQLAILNPGGTT